MSALSTSTLGMQSESDLPTTLVLVPSAPWLALLAPCLLVGLAIVRIMRQRASHLKQGVSTMVPLQDVDTLLRVIPKQLTLADATLELLRQPIPSSERSWYTQTPTRNRRSKPVPTPTMLPAITAQVASPTPSSPIRAPASGCGSPRAIAPPCILITPPEGENPLARFLPFKSGWIVPKQNTSGRILKLPGLVPTTAAHYSIRLPVH
ncbi:hypothetical protein BKA62DRAFT_764229 [Auriculariales sp. MPI-PUGE-AT-0066]|nr:hypothetical protein BKA62DRAFT_764229 [Auriculariales sp. MPI-PUGE-AT-0066]